MDLPKTYKYVKKTDAQNFCDCNLFSYECRRKKRNQHLFIFLKNFIGYFFNVTF